MKRSFFALAAVLVLGAGLSACSDNDDDVAVVVPPPVTPTPPPAASRLEDQFGTSFGTLFRAGLNTEPTDPAPGAVIALTLTAEPVAVP